MNKLKRLAIVFILFIYTFLALAVGATLTESNMIGVQVIGASLMLIGVFGILLMIIFWEGKK